MSERTSKKPGIADYVAARRKHEDSFLDEIDRLIDWKPLEKCFAKSSSGWPMPSATRPTRTTRLSSAISITFGLPTSSARPCLTLTDLA